MRFRIEYVKSTLWRLSSAILLILSISFFIYLYLHKLSDLMRIWAKLSGMILVAVALCLRQARKWNTVPARKLLSEDERQLILYLRPFEVEREAHPLMMAIQRKFPQKKTDEYLVEILKGIGPFITIADPRKKVAELGAARLKVKDKEWQAEVSRLMHEARFILLHAAASKTVFLDQVDKIMSLALPIHMSPATLQARLKNEIKALYDIKGHIDVSNGLHWEVKEAITRNYHKKLILIIPYDLQAYQAFKKAVACRFPNPLPEVSYPKKRWWQMFLEDPVILGFVYFDSLWKPNFVEVKKPTWREWIMQPGEAAVTIKVSLEKVINTLDSPTQNEKSTATAM